MSTSVTEATFQDEVLASETPVIVDFWAEWCGPCHAVAPVLDRIVEERSDVKLVKVNIDEEQGLALRYGVASIPTMILFKAASRPRPRSAPSRSRLLEKALGLVSPSYSSSGSTEPSDAARFARKSSSSATPAPAQSSIHVSVRSSSM